MANETRLYGSPGTGKTTALSAYAKRGVELYGDGSVVLTSFTKAAAQEIASRFTKDIEHETGIHKGNVGTLHSFAYRALDAPTIADKQEANWNAFCDDAGYPEYALTDTKSGVGFLDEMPEDHMGQVGGDVNLNTYSLLRSKMVPKDQWPVALWDFINLWERFKTETDSLDFCDIIQLCISDVEFAPGRPNVFIADEAQDSVPLLLELTRKWGSRADQFVIAGDPDQAIYGWLGASPKAFLYPEIPQEQKRYLKQSYRVPRAVHAYSTHWTDLLSVREKKEYIPRDAEGEVRRLGARYTKPKAAVEDARRYLEEGKTVCFMASCSFLLKPLVYELRDAGIPFHNEYRRSRGDWNPLSGGTAKSISTVRRLLSFAKGNPEAWPNSTSEMTGDDLRNWTDMLRVTGNMIRGAKKRILQFPDGEIEWMRLIPELFEESAQSPVFEQDVYWLLANVTESYQKRLDFPVKIATQYGWEHLHKKPLVTVGTIHSLKGSEFDVCYVFPDLSFAGIAEYKETDPDSVNRLFYVACTRAKESLILCAPSTPRHVDW